MWEKRGGRQNFIFGWGTSFGESSECLRYYFGTSLFVGAVVEGVSIKVS